MPALNSYEYAIIRIVPRVERGECVNVGIILHCRQRRYLAAQLELGAQQRVALAALAPNLDFALLQQHLESIPAICRGGTGNGPVAKLSQAERFHWLVAPSSTIIQPSPVHTGLCTDPAVTANRLMQTLVRRE